MNYRIVLNTTGKVLRIEGVLMLLPVIVSLIYQEWLPLLAFGATAVGTFLIGFLLATLVKPKNSFMFAKERLNTG